MLVGSQAWAQFEMGASAPIGAGGTFGINSVADFYSPLAPYGMWLNVGSFGRRWHPTNVGPGWRPLLRRPMDLDGRGLVFPER